MDETWENLANIKASERHELFQSRAARHPIPHVTVDEKGVVLSANGAAIRTLASTAKALIGVPFLTFVPGGDKQKFVQSLMSAIIEDDPHESEILILTNSGERSVNLHASKIQIRGKFEIDLCLIDVTEQRRTEVLLQRIIDDNPSPLVVIDKAKVIIRCNETAEAFFLREKSWLCGRHITNLFDKSSTDQLLKTITYSANNLSMHPVRTDPKSPAFAKVRCARSRPVNISASSFRDSGGVLTVLNLQDATADVSMRKELEDARRVADLARRSAERASKIKSKFLANMSHEIRTPVSSIVGYSDLLAKDMSPLKRIECTQIIERNAQQLLRLIDDILDLSKVEAGTMNIQRSKLNPSDELVSIREMLLPLARQKGITFELEIDNANLPGWISIDGVRLRQIVTNLLNNAIKFTDEGCVTLAVKFKKGDDGTSRLSIFVKDSGSGMSTTTVSQIFSSFQQGEVDSNKRRKGTGLGLALSKKIAKLMSGDVILLNTALGEGSEFCALFDLEDHQFGEELGLAESSNKGSSEKGFAQSQKKNSLANCNILLAEDTEEIAALMCYHLDKAGAHVTVVENGEQAVSLAMNNRYDAILMDVQMPKLDGLAATKKLRASGSDVPIIALTAHALESEKQRCLSAGCDIHLSKPVTPKQLEQSIKDLI